MIFGGFKLKDALMLNTTGLTATAHVTAIETREVRVRKNESEEYESRFREVVQFQTATGAPIEAVLLEKHDAKACFPVGAAVTIRYNPTNPTEVSIDGDKAPLIIASLLMILGLAFSSVSITLLLKD